jgi:hypothetical protein
MFNRYSQAQSLVGTVRSVVSASYGGATVQQVTATSLQFEKPSKLYLRQDLLPRSGHPAKTWLVTSDGVHFSYSIPNNMVKAGSDRLIEAVSQPERAQVMDVAHIYGVASQSLGDRCEALGIAVGWNEELRRITETWETLGAPEPAALDKVEGYWIRGSYRQNALSRSSGTYEMFITNEGELREYVIHELVGAPASASLAPTVVTTTWTVDFKLGAKPDPSLFRVVVR